MKKKAEETKDISIIEPTILDKPGQDTQFAHQAAKLLMEIVHKNNWAKKLGGDKAHLAYEAWQTVGKYYGYSVKTHDAQSVEIGGIQGFKAYATVVNELTGIEVGGAEAYCMRDENNWKMKPTFQLASMAQTRAGSKALRQILGFVVALAGFNPTPAEEMTGEETKPVSIPRENNEAAYLRPSQLSEIMALLKKKGKTTEDLQNAIRIFNKFDYGSLTPAEADKIILRLQSLPNAEEIVDIDKIPNTLGE